MIFNVSQETKSLVMTDTAQPVQQLDGATTLRLRLCVACFAIIGLAAIWRERHDTMGLAFHILSYPVLVWVARIGVYRSPALHRLWGGVCFLGSVAIVVLLVLAVFGVRDLRADRFPLGLIVGLIQMPIVAYLLVFDRHIAHYRRQLSLRGSKSSSA